MLIQSPPFHTKTFKFTKRVKKSNFKHELNKLELIGSVQLRTTSELVNSDPDNRNLHYSVLRILTIITHIFVFGLKKTKKWIQNRLVLQKIRFNMLIFFYKVNSLFVIYVSTFYSFKLSLLTVIK